MKVFQSIASVFEKRAYTPQELGEKILRELSKSPHEINTDKIRRLISLNADLTVRNQAGDQPLLAAARKEHLAAFDALLDSGRANPNDQNEDDGATALMSMAESRDCERLKALAKVGADPNLRDKKGRTALFRTVADTKATAANTDVIRTLLAIGADPNIPNTTDEVTPLMLATLHDQNLIIAGLLDAGADPFRNNKVGFNAYDMARGFGRKQIIETIETKARLEKEKADAFDAYCATGMPLKRAIKVSPIRLKK